LNLRPMAGKDQPPAAGEANQLPNPERFLTLLAEGAARGMPEVDAAACNAFRASVNKLSLRLPDRLPDEEKLALIRAILHEFESYRNGSEATLRERLARWRSLTETLLRELLATLNVDPAKPAAAQLVRKAASLTTAEEIQACRALLEEFLHPPASSDINQPPSPLKVADLTTTNNNAAGLRGGGSAVEFVKTIMDRGGKGYIAHFRLGCLDMIIERFGEETVQDSLMAVSAFLTHSLHRDDVIYHWSDSELLAVLQNRVNEQVVNAELQRIVARNRDITVNVEGRNIMLRIPLDFKITPISALHAADDLYRLSMEPAAAW